MNDKRFIIIATTMPLMAFILLMLVRFAEIFAMLMAAFFMVF